ncbi:hypothetical protein K0M31_002959 [Melipona bicolor]|uniref:Uncharacterized protein n=1 Tax=Melipona bicolor TaxID=60889 RepID=A0AA40G002_9HYME|nr:hypothetical protein K0M31_002959 [Melipona bicolor]
MSYIREHDRVRGSIKGNPQHLAASVLADPCSRAQHRTWCEASRFVRGANAAEQISPNYKLTTSIEPIG